MVINLLSLELILWLVLERAVDNLSSVLSDPSCSQHIQPCQFGADLVGAGDSSHNQLARQLQNQQAPFRHSAVRTRAAGSVPDLLNVQPWILEYDSTVHMLHSS